MRLVILVLAVAISVVLVFTDVVKEAILVVCAATVVESDDKLLERDETDPCKVVILELIVAKEVLILVTLAYKDVIFASAATIAL